MIKENIVFIKEFLAEFQNTGSAFPTSRWAAEALTAPLQKIRTPKKILELGPGTGSVTIEILANMIDGDELTICEINPRFMAALKKRIQNNPDFIKHKSRIKFYECPMQELPEDCVYEVIVCALPFLNFSLDMVQEIFAKLKRLSDEKAVMTYYEYIGLRSLCKSPVSPPLTKRRIKAIDKYFKDVYSLSQMTRERVWLNLLPINIYTLKMAA